MSRNKVIFIVMVIIIIASACVTGTYAVYNADLSVLSVGNTDSKIPALTVNFDSPAQLGFDFETGGAYNLSVSNKDAAGQVSDTPMAYDIVFTIVDGTEAFPSYIILTDSTYSGGTTIAYAEISGSTCTFSAPEMSFGTIEETKYFTVVFDVTYQAMTYYSVTVTATQVV